MIALVVLIWLLAIFVDTSQCPKLVIRSLSMPAKKFPANILLIDDDEDEYFIFEDIIRHLDSSIELNYLSGPNQVHAGDEFPVPDILFLDINMPTWSGFDWLQWIRDKGHKFPVIMYSTSRNPDVVRRAYGAGAHLYLNKPMDFQELVSSVTYILQLDWTKPAVVFCKSVLKSMYGKNWSGLYRLGLFCSVKISRV